MVDKLREVYESDPLAMASAYGVEAVDPEETVQAAKDVAQFGWESLPGVGTYYTVQDITEELEQENPNYMRIGMLAGTEVIGLIPGIGDAAANLIRKGAKFKTKRGSVYTVEDESRTTRERAPDTPDGDFVKQPTSGKTIYMSYEDMERFGPLFQKGEPGLYQFRPSGEGKAQLVFTKDYGPYKAGDPVPDTEVSFTLEPELGMNPVEIYDSTNNARTSIHFGNEIVEVESDIPKVSRDKNAKPQMSNEEYDSLFLNLDEAETPEEWQQGAKALIKKGRVADPSIKTPELEDSTRLLLDNKITREEHLANVDKYKPVNPWDALPREPSDKALVFALDSGKRTDGLFVLDDATTEALGVAKSPLSVGMRFNGRLDIPAYNYHDTWIVAGTSPAVKTADNKGVTTYAKAIHYVADGDKPVKFVASPKTSEAIGTGEKNKTGYATVSGIVGDLDVDAIRAKAAQYLNDPEWTQVGFDPRRQGGFYVRAGENKHVPVREATEVIQIGPLVLARNAKLDFEYSGYNEGGMAKADFESLEAYKEFLQSLDDIAEFRDKKGDKYSSSAKRINTFSYPSRKTSPITKSDKGVPLTIAGNELLKHKEYKDDYFSNNPSHEIIKADGTKDREYSYRLDRKSGAAEGATFLDALVAEFEVLANKEAEDKISEKEQVLLDAYRVFLTERTGMNEGGMAMDEQMNAVFKSSRTGYAVGGSVDLDSVPDNTVGLDPVSGNEIPLGSLPEEVRDDIPAQLSEGEYVVPADVVRYYGVKFFEDLRAEAKFGYQDMNENGRIGGEPPEGMEMIEPEDDMMFDISELEVMEVPDEPEGAFFGKLFGSKKKEPSVRERFDAAAKRDNSPAAIQKRVQAMQAQNRAAGYSSGKKAAPAAKPKSSGPSIAEQINFGGDYEDKPSGGSMFSNLFGGDDKKDKKPKDKSTSLAKDSVYTGQDDGETFAEKINFGGNYNQGGYAESGGYALSPGDEGYDEMGSLGLGSEGLPLGTGEDAVGGAVEMVAYVNDEGRVIYIMHINGVPQNEIPPGFYPRTEEENTQTSSGTGSQPVAQVIREVGSDYNDRLDDMDIPMPEGVDYASLTTEEMMDMLEEQQSAKMDIITAGAAAVNPIMGLFLKGAMVHQARQLEREIERRLEGELTTQERTQLEGLLKQSKEGKPGLIRRIYGALKDEFTEDKEEEDKGPEAYTPEVAAGSVTLPTTPKPEGMLETSTDDLVKAFAPPEQFAMEEYRRAQQRKAEKEAQAAQMAAAAATGPSTADLAAAAENNRREAAADARRRASEVASAAKSTGKSIQEVGKAIGPSSTQTETEKATGGKGSQALGSGAGGMKKGGLASKKKKK